MTKSLSQRVAAESARREAELVANARPKPLPKRRRLTNDMRHRLRTVRFVYSMNKMPFASDDERLGWSMVVDAANTFTVEFFDEDKPNSPRFGSLMLHTIPLGTGVDLLDMADATMDVPHWEISDAFHRSWPREWVLEQWGLQCAPGQSFMLVENVELDDDWRGWGLEPVFTALAMRQVVRFVPDVRFALATPVYWWERGEERRFAQVVHQKCLKGLGFERLTRESGTWILPDFQTFEVAVDALRGRLRLPEYLFS